MRPITRMPRLVVLVTLVMLLLVSVALAQTGDGFDLSWWTVDGGGGSSSGGIYTLSGTIGLPDAVVVLSGDPYMVVGGFWAALIEEPTAIELISFTAEAAADHVTLAWETASEMDNEGFNIWRSETADGQYTKLNANLIPAQGNADTGASYEYTDADVVKGVTYYYQLEDVDIHGVSTFHGPVSATLSQIRRIYLPLILK
jgi:hypothetical protein